MSFNLYINDIGMTLNFFKLFFINIFTYYTSLKLLNVKTSILHNFLLLIISFISCIFAVFLYYHFTYVSSFLFWWLFSFIMLVFTTHYKFGYSLYISTVSICINTILRLFSIILCYYTLLFSLSYFKFTK